MTRRSHHRATSARWPFWLLLLAWGCAHSPQTATFAVLNWMDHARQFSHQKRLTSEVAHLLMGEKTPAHIVVATAETSARGPLAVPAGAELKKIDLVVERTLGVPLAARMELPRRRHDGITPESGRAAPPHEPPRV